MIAVTLLWLRPGATSPSTRKPRRLPRLQAGPPLQGGPPTLGLTVVAVARLRWRACACLARSGLGLS